MGINYGDVKSVDRHYKRKEYILSPEGETKF